jgi:hypothetical protein
MDMKGRNMLQVSARFGKPGCGFARNRVAGIGDTD